MLLLETNLVNLSFVRRKGNENQGRGVLVCDSSQDYVMKDCMVDFFLLSQRFSRNQFFITHHHTCGGVA